MDTAKQINVLYVSYDGMTDPLGQSQVIPYLIGLTKKGFSFTILSCEKEERYTANKEVISQLLTAASIIWEPVLYTKKPPVFSTLFDYYKLRKKAVHLNNRLHFKLVHCRSYIPALLGLWMKRKYQVPFLFDMRGFWADERIDGDIWKIENPVFRTIYHYFKRREIDFLRDADAVVSLTEAGKNEIMRWKSLNISAQKISVIPCCADVETFDPDKISVAEQHKLRLRLGLGGNDFVVGYLGSIGTWYLLDEMIRFFFLLKKEMPHAKLLFVTHDDPSVILLKVQQYGVNSSDVIMTSAERKEVPLMISLFTYGLFFIKPAYSKMASSPTKQGELMAMGVPVICNSGVGDTDQIVSCYDSGLTVMGDHFEETIRQLAAGRNYQKNKIRAGALDFFSLDNGIAQYHRIYSRICK
ncbi:glycosyltransferase [Pedobacter sp. L105]|uniref:glycosyltransferase n=1 Tax=Pedobacter sp. L105 TaxID=1641871 RepID=UPI00131C466C|nr:glycosyltransferase [Pedobacter sp. L105]